MNTISNEDRTVAYRRPTCPPLCFGRRVSNGVRKKGFTLIELMIVVIIIGALASMVLPRLIGQTTKARRAIANSDIRTIESAIELYEGEIGFLPKTLDDLMKKPSGSAAKFWDGPYLKKSPKDPWSNPYQYRPSSDHPGKDFDIWSWAQDGKDGTEDDIVSWED